MLLFEHLNLRYNPFETPPAERWGKLAVPVAGFDADELAEWLAEPGRAILLTGESGRGKSTHMRAIWRHYPDAPWIYVGPGEKPEFPHARLLFLDEAQRVGWWRRHKLWRRVGSIVATSHSDYMAEMEQAGLEVRHWEVGGLDADRLRRVLDVRIEEARRAPGPIPTFSDAAVARLLGDFGDDLRAMLDVLYDVFQALDEPRQIDLDGELYASAYESRPPPSRHVE